MNPENIILENGSYLSRAYGKYKPNLTFLHEEELENFPFSTALPSPLEIDGHYIGGLRGEYFVSKKGTKCFRISPHGREVLYRYTWGGAFLKSRGHYAGPDKVPQMIYFRRASSNGGGNGYTYFILPVGYIHTIREEDL